MMRRLVAAVVVLAVAGAARAEGTLGIGDPAPKLEVKEFVKGDPVKALEKGKVYVVEFWATWCGPCRTSIPHITELQKKHKDVTVIGVSVSEQDFGKVKPFVEDMGDKMDYRVAIDAVPEGKDAQDGAMSKNWMGAAEQNGIPTAFIVNGDGVIAWIGHPMRMDQPLADIVAGSWDVKAQAIKAKEEKARQQKLRAIAGKLRKAQQSGDPKEVLAVVDDVLKDDPKMEATLGGIKFNALVGLGDAATAAEYGRALIDGAYKDNAQQLNELAWDLVDPDATKDKKPDPKLARVALAAAAKAVALTGDKDAGIIDTLAAAHFAAGDVAQAVAVQERAVKLQPDDADLKQHLELYKKALEKAKKSE
jgi:thiol-disulfide isomerase/thioredoxin